MGVTQVTVAVRNPAEPEGQRTYGLADGSDIRMDITVGRVEFMGEVVGATIVMGEEGAEPLLGVTALESVGIEVDPLNQTLKRLPSTRLRGFRPRLLELEDYSLLNSGERTICQGE